MKTRNGFVSNSSSCSFLIVGIPTPVDKLLESNIPDGIACIGRDLSDAADVFTITSKEMLDFVREHSNQFECFINSEVFYDWGGNEDAYEIDKDDVGKHVVVGKADQHSSNSMDALKYNYRPDRPQEW